MILGAAPFWGFNTFNCLFCLCSGFELLMVQAMQFILGIWAGPNFKGFYLKTVIPRKGQTEASKGNNNPNSWVKPNRGLKFN